jgi:hypothetical protein
MDQLAQRPGEFVAPASLEKRVTMPPSGPTSVTIAL